MSGPLSWHSCLYEGTVRHRRFAPARHEFRYPLFLMYVDLDELPTLFHRRWLWSASRPNVAWFRRADHFGPASQPLAESVRELVAERTGHRPGGSIRLLTHFRYFGCAMNPISLYYCFAAGGRVEFVVAEVTNTPWGERHCYVLDVRAQPGPRIRCAAAKELHVSPFLGMDFHYDFRLTAPSESLVVHIANRPRSAIDTRPLFDATLTLQRRPLNGRQLARALSRYPCMTAQVIAGIYGQAFRLWRKAAPFVPHPATNALRGGGPPPADVPAKPFLPAIPAHNHESQKVTS